MLTIKINTIGDLKKSAYADIVEELVRKTNQQARGEFKVEYVAHKDENPEQKVVLKDLLDELDKGDVSMHSQYFLAEYGEDVSTRGLQSKIVRGLEDLGVIEFWVANAWGWDKSGVNSESLNFLSLSPLTFNHELAAVMLAEQLYRFADVQAGGNYAK